MKLSRRDFLRTSAIATAAVAAGMAKPETLFGSPFAGNLTGPAVASNVFIVVIDGLRNDEAFDDPQHTYIPRIWNDLRPLGAINTNFWNTGLTATTTGHIQMLTGVRQILHLERSETGKVVSRYPSILEYYRKEKNIPKGKVWVISGKGEFTNSINTSLYPEYAGWEASKDSVHRTDLSTWEAVSHRMDTYHPSLMIINLGEVDHSGHSNIFSSYAKSIQVADEIVYRLWQKIQRDPYYMDKTDLIVTTDHGRSSDGNGRGFMDHGNDDHGNRHLLFLAVGPDFKQNVQLTDRGDHIDIAHTVGAILGVQVPHGEGRVMKELFKDPDLGNTVFAGGQRRIRLSAYADGVHAVWSEKRGQEWDIWYKKSTDNGTVWTQPIKLFSNGDDACFYEADITSRDDGTVYVAATGYALADRFGDTYVWKLYGVRSTDGGATFSAPVELTAAKEKGRAASPHVISNGTYIVVAYAADVMESLISSDGGATFSTYLLDQPVLGFHYRAMYSDIAMNDGNIYAVWSNDRDRSPVPQFWNIFFNKFDLSNPAWGIPLIITPDADNYDPGTVYLDNAVAVNDRGLIKVVSARRSMVERNGKIFASKWSCFLQTSEAGMNFKGYALMPLADDEWSPRISFLNPSADDFIMVWERHAGGAGGEIMGRAHIGGSWGAVLAISPPGTVSAEPSLSVYNGNVYAGWQELVNGVWKVEVRKVL